MAEGKEARASEEMSASQSNPHWLQSGVVSGLGLSIGSGGNSLGDLWGPPSRQPSIWAAKRLDADAVPDSLQVGALAAEKAAEKIRPLDQFSQHAAPGAHCRVPEERVRWGPVS